MIYLDDYLDQPDFRSSLRALAADFRQALGLPPDLDELGLVCADVEKAAKYLQDNYPGMGTSPAAPSIASARSTTPRRSPHKGSPNPSGLRRSSPR